MNLQISLADSFFFVYYYYKGGRKWYEVGAIPQEKEVFMFIGEFKHTTDAKGRVSIPKIFREDLGESFYITKGLDKSLFVFTQEEWDRFQVKLQGIPLTNKTGRAFTRFFYAGATKCSMDKSGRILIPQNLRDFAEIDRDTLLIGAGSRVEIWSDDVWTQYNEDELSYDELADSMAELGI